MAPFDEHREARIANGAVLPGRMERGSGSLDPADDPEVGFLSTSWEDAYAGWEVSVYDDDQAQLSDWAARDPRGLPVDQERVQSFEGSLNLPAEAAPTLRWSVTQDVVGAEDLLQTSLGLGLQQTWSAADGWRASLDAAGFAYRNRRGPLDPGQGEQVAHTSLFQAGLARELGSFELFAGAAVGRALLSDDPESSAPNDGDTPDAFASQRSLQAGLRKLTDGERQGGLRIWARRTGREQWIGSPGEEETAPIRHRGADLDWAWSPLEALTIESSAHWSSAHFRDGSRVPLSVERLLQATVTPERGATRLSLRGRHFRAPASALVFDAWASWRLGPGLQLSLAAFNLANQQFEGIESLQPLGDPTWEGTDFSGSFATPTAPFSLRFGLTVTL